VPLVIDWPGLPAARRGKKSFRLAENVDLAATFLDAAGLARPSEMQGESLKPLVFGQNVPWRRDAFYEHQLTWPFIPKGEAVRGARWKYVRYNSEDPPYEQLFDLQADPREEHDILHTPALFDRRPWFYRRQLSILRARWRELREGLGTDQAPAEAQAIGCRHVLDPVPAPVLPSLVERLFQN
jgi:arylsulfatase A-like enzyme